MVIYFVVFALSILAMKRAVRWDGVSKRRTQWSLFLVVFPLLLLAALRGDRVGSDVLFYQKDLYVHALHFTSPIQYIKWSYEEIGYSLVSFLGSRFRHFAFVHLFNMMIILLPIVFMIWDLRREIDPELSLASFLFLYYVQGYNMARQQMAISLMALGVYEFSKKKYVLALLLGILAMGFHYSAVAGFFSYFLYWMAGSRLKKVYQLVLLTIVVWVSLNFEQLGRSFGGILVNVLHITKRSYRSSKAWSSTSSDINETYLLWGTVGILILILVGFAANTIDKVTRTFLFYMLFILLTSTIITRNMGFAARVFCYFEIWVIFVIPLIIKLIKDDFVSKAIAKSMIYIGLSVFWIFGVVIKGWHTVIPYYFFWQG